MITEFQLESMDGIDSLSVSAYEGGVLKQIVQAHHRKQILEIGTGYGYSAAWISIGLSADAHFMTIDTTRRTLYFRDGRVDYLIGPMGEIEKDLPTDIDFLFLDSDHTMDAVHKDMEFLKNRLSDDAMVAVHDTQYVPQFGECLSDYFKGIESSRLAAIGLKPIYGKWNYRELKTRFGLGIASKKTEAK